MSVQDSPTIRIGILGGSSYAAEMLDLFHLRVQGCHVVALFALHPNEPASLLARQLGIPVFNDLDLFFDRLKTDAEVLYNASPPHLHYETSHRALEIGLQVWLEKPPVTSLETFERMEKAIGGKNQLVQVCFNTLYNPALLSLRNALQKGVFGRIRAIHTIGGLPRPAAYFMRNRWAGRIRADGSLIRDGSLSNALSHTVVNALFCGGTKGRLLDTLTLLESKLCRLVSPEAEDTASLTATGSDGCFYSFNLSLGVDEKISPTNRIETDAGTIYFENYSEIRFGDDVDHSCRSEVFPLSLHDDVRLTMIAILRKVASGEVPPYVPFAKTRPFVELLEEVYGNNPPIENLAAGEEGLRLKRLIRKDLMEAYKKGSLLEYGYQR